MAQSTRTRRLALLGLAIGLAGLPACGPRPAGPAAGTPTRMAVVTSATPLPTLVISATPLPTPAATATPQPTPGPPTPLPATPVPTPQPATPTPAAPGGQDLAAVVGVAPGDVLNVRAGPGVSHPVVGTLPPYATGVQVVGAEQDVDGAGWAPIRYGDLDGWAHTGYLARQVGTADEAVARRAVEIIQALKQGDYAALAGLVHPEQGVRFSPYTFVSDQDLVFSAGQVGGFGRDPAVYRWGSFDGSGEPIELTAEGYFGRFVTDVDFARPEAVGFNQVIGRGNTLNNIGEFYPGAAFVEYHFSGFDPAYAGLDWRSLRLILEQKDGDWYLVGIVHDEWTI